MLHFAPTKRRSSELFYIGSLKTMSKPEPSRPKTKSYENMGVDGKCRGVKTWQRRDTLREKEGAARQTPGVNITGFWRLYETD